MDYSRVVAATLISPQGQAAVAAGEVRLFIRLMRKQRDGPSTSSPSGPVIPRRRFSAWSAASAAQDMVILADIAQALGVPPAALGVIGESGQAAQCWTALRRLVKLDDREGGATVYQVAEEMVRRLQEALRRGSYVPAVGRELQSVTAATMEHAAWLAYDAGWQHKARYWWLEACHVAGLAGIPDVRVTALASMALKASTTPDGGRETVDLAHAARTAAHEGRPPSPTLLSLLAAREAVGHAQTGDRLATVSAMSQARQWLDHGRRGDEPFWLDFWGPANLARHEARVALVTGNGKSAELAARAALGNSDADAFPRNHVAYTVDLASILTQRGQLDEAISLTSDAIHGVQGVQGSGLIIANLYRTVDLLGKQKYPPATTFSTAARRLLPT